jgi:hypothetical protein
MMETKVKCYVLSGLGHAPSNGIIYNLAAELVQIDGVEVEVGSHTQWERFADDARSLEESVSILALTHSLGASVAPAMARRIGKPVEAIFGWDPADNLAANMSQYRLTPVPENVALAVAIYIPGGGLGGGIYMREGGTPDDPGHGIKNIAVEDSHTKIEEAIEDHLIVVDTARRLAA